ncbi:hypothetical protein C8R43DRAFT_597642 [Mycena crocata]|nr:hypothetical protein C8R43DRAFT_597642 [Mycena crocata]
MTTTADPPAAGVLVPYTSQLPPVDTRAFGERWPILTPSSPGRTLNEVYSTVGLALETRSNRMAYRLGLGPEVSAQKIASSFGTGEERQVQLASLRNEIPTKLERYCSRLMDYTLPIESPKTQLQAFKQIITLATDFPGLRFIFLGAKILQSVPIIVEAICALWDRPGSPLDPESLFWQRFAATCLSETNIAVILEQTPVDKLALCLLDSGGLGVIERLLIAYDCVTEG